MDGSLIIGGTNASGPLPADDLFAPLTMQVLTDVCAAECSADECGTIIRHAIDVGFGDDQVTVYDRTTGIVGQLLSYVVMVGGASGFVDFGMCSDIPGAWYRVIVYDGGEG